LGKRTITARQVLSTTPNNIPFGTPMVIIPTVGGGDTVVGVVDYVGSGSGQQSGTLTAALIAGIAINEVTTNLTFPGAQTPGALNTGYYGPGGIAEMLEEGSIMVQINNGTPASQAVVYVRTALNASVPAGVVGGFEAANTTGVIAWTGVVFRTGVLDANNMAEITLPNRVAA